VQGGNLSRAGACSPGRRKEAAVATEIEKRNAQQHLDWVIRFLIVGTLPAIGAGLVIGGEVVAAGAAGFRRRGSNQKTQPDDLFHLGSITKPLTGYLFARLIRQNRLSWSRTIGQSHPEAIAALDAMPGADADWVEHYRNTTAADLMMHVSAALTTASTGASLTAGNCSPARPRR